MGDGGDKSSKQKPDLGKQEIDALGKDIQSLLEFVPKAASTIFNRATGNDTQMEKYLKDPVSKSESIISSGIDGSIMEIKPGEIIVTDPYGKVIVHEKDTSRPDFNKEQHLPEERKLSNADQSEGSILPPAIFKKLDRGPGDYDAFLQAFATIQGKTYEGIYNPHGQLWIKVKDDPRGNHHWQHDSATWIGSVKVEKDGRLSGKYDKSCPMLSSDLKTSIQAFKKK